jgi:hypothetical protein
LACRLGGARFLAPADLTTRRAHVAIYVSAAAVTAPVEPTSVGSSCRALRCVCHHCGRASDSMVAFAGSADSCRCRLTGAAPFCWRALLTAVRLGGAGARALSVRAPRRCRCCARHRCTAPCLVAASSAVEFVRRCSVLMGRGIGRAVGRGPRSRLLGPVGSCWSSARMQGGVGPFPVGGLGSAQMFLMLGRLDVVFPCW